MKRILLVLFSSHFFIGNILAQISVTNGSPSFLIDFSNTTTTTVGTNPQSPYGGAGFESNPTTAGRLNSNAWAVTGWSDGPLVFGGTNITGDYAGGSVSTAQTTGGFYAYTGAPASVANPTFMIQPGGSDFSPGTLTLRIQNNGVDPITQLNVNYNLFIRNDEGRSNSFNFSFSSDNVSYTPIPALDYTSPAAVDALGWVLVGTAPSRSTAITGLNIPPGSFVYIRWSSDDVGGSGSRDEFGLDDINVIATFTPISTDYYRSVNSGNWNTAATWETSPTNAAPWSPALLPPTSVAKNIFIRNGHMVTIDANMSADELIIETGGTLNHTNGITFNLNNGLGTDMTLNGIYVLNGTQPSGSGTILIQNGSTVRVDGNSSPNESDDFAFGNPNVTFLTGSTYQWATTNTPQWSNQVYFTPGQITTYRFTSSPSGILGGGGLNTTTIHGVLQVDVDITIHNSANKIFMNGITGSGNIFPAPSFTGNIIINGATAILEGAGIITMPAAPSVLQIGSNSVVTMNSSKTIIGDVSLLANSYVDLGTNNLTVSGNVTGGSATSYIRTASTGALILNVVTTFKDFPVGHTKYNPVRIENVSNHNWTVNVNDGVTADIPRTTDGAVLVTWNITPSVNPPSTGADITFQFDRSSQVGSEFDNPLYNNPDNLQAWHRKLGYWYASGVPAPVNFVSGNFYNVKTLGATQFSPYGLSRISLPLPIKLVDFAVKKISGNLAIINWELAVCCSKDARFELEKSTDKSNFSVLSIINGSETNRFYSYTDARLSKGTTWYRLKMTDVDGSVKYSKVIAIVNEEKGFLITSIAPNPTQDEATILLSAAKQGGVHFKVYDIAGTMVKQWYSTIAEGNNNINMNVAEIARGLYHVLAYDLDSKATFRFIKQ